MSPGPSLGWPRMGPWPSLGWPMMGPWPSILWPKMGPGKFMVWLPWCLQNYARWMQRFICHDCGSVLDEWKQSWLEFWQNTLLLVVRHIWHLYLSLSLSLSVALYLCLYLSISFYLSRSLYLSLFVGRPMNNSGQICIKRASTSSLMAWHKASFNKLANGFS